MNKNSRKYHDVLIDLIGYILKNGNAYLSCIDSGNAYDKIIRNYHQFNLKGEKVYRNIKLMKLHYRYTKEAWLCKDDLSKLYFEHLVPIKIIKKELSDLIDKNVNFDDVKSIIHKTEIVVLTRDQSELLDKKYKSEMPKDGIDRLKIMNFEIEPQSEKK